MSVNPKAPDFRQMSSTDYAQLFHDAADSAAKDYDRPFDVLQKEHEDRERRHAEKHGDEEDELTNLPDMKDVLVMTNAKHDDTELLI